MAWGDAIVKRMTFLSLAVLLAACGVAAGQIGRWSDRWDAINIALPYVAIPVFLAAMAVLVAAWRRNSPARWPAVAAILVLLAGPLPLLLGEWQGYRAPRCTGEPLRIVQFNAWKDNRATPAAARWIRLVDPDLVLVEEAHAMRPLPMLLRDAYPYQQSCIGPSFCSTAILAKTRPLASGGLARADPENRGALSSAWMRIGGARGPFTVVAVHLGRPWPFARFVGDRDQLAGFVRAQPSATTIVAGDFNLPGWTFQLHRLEAAMGVSRRSFALPSWPALVDGRRTPMPLLPIDHLFAGRDWSVVSVRRGPFLGSDHFPLVVDLRRCSGGQP